jgi:HD-GYP domain-containing protein (c-di-GMP phosphodiesterase class II)
VVTLAAYHYDEPSLTLFMLLPCSHGAMLRRSKSGFAALATIVTFVFCGVPLLVGGSEQWAWVPIAALALAVSVVVHSYFGAQIPEMQFERRRFASTAAALLIALGARDGYTAEHSEATVELTLEVADELGLGTDERSQLIDVALLHDVGKIGIPNEVLQKPSKLTQDEWEIMRQHPVIGEDIVSRVPGYEAVAKAIRHEHERWDGGGYPDGISGETIPLASRIVLACDAFHAMTSDRPYRQAMPLEDACDELLRSAGTQLDPNVVTALVATLERKHGALASAEGALWRRRPALARALATS